MPKPIVHLLYSLVEGGHRAVLFDRFQGVKPEVTGEGTHFLIPWVQKPIIFDIRSRPRNVAVTTGSKGNDKFVDSAQYKWNYLRVEEVYLQVILCLIWT